ncbi:AraC family transcriptional regulator [Coraliomargarita parva]|uniref:AraC family transcriptional regulator n=1 Tax=Coraliomargarita parva TaxID=3014050 RepID=UPI0022B38FFF|nr:AraC family transcriptional regulator [Coraliomargarita parva]
MVELKRLAGESFDRLVIEPDIWFYMNHVREQESHAAHSHSYLELAFVLQGSASHITVQGGDACRRGDLIVIPRGAWHAYADCRGLELVNCLFSPRMLGNELGWLEEDPELARLLAMGPYSLRPEVFKIKVGESGLTQVEAHLEHLGRAYQAESPRTVLIASVLQLLEALRASLSRPVPALQANHKLHPSVRRALESFSGQLDRDWRLPELASLLRLNPSYLVRLFHEQTGLSPMKYLSQLRAERAANLLLSTRLRVGEIGLQVGWPDPKVFSRKFRQHFGMRASEYRLKMLRPMSR